MSETILKVEEISKQYGEVKALDHIMFNLSRGEILGLFGKNGSGKSTLLNIVALAVSADEGNIFIDNQNVSKNLKKSRRRIGYVPQEIALFEELTVEENLLCWSRLPGKLAKKRALEIAEQMNIKDLYKKKVSALSGGMKRRVNTAVALLGEPEILILDEPFAGVDTDNTEWIGELLQNMGKRGVSQMISGHSPDLLYPYIDSVMVLSDGEIVFYGKKEEFIQLSDRNNPGDALKKLLRREGL